MAKIVIEIKNDGEYCGQCEEQYLQTISSSDGYECHYYCKKFPGEIIDDKRLSECIAAEKAAESVLMIDGMPYGSKTTG